MNPRRLWPRNLLGQTLLALALALLVAQGISAFLLYRAASERREAALLNTAAFAFVTGSGRIGMDAARGDFHRMMMNHANRAPHMPMHRFPWRLRYSVSPSAPLLPGEQRNTQREEALRELLARQSVDVQELVVTERPAISDPAVERAMAAMPRLRSAVQGRSIRLLIAGLRHAGSTEWEVVRLPIPKSDPRAISGLLLQTVILFVLLMAFLYVVLRRITGPLAALTERTANMAFTGMATPPLPPSGPADIRRLIHAHNAMETRIGAMLEEKNVMLGAIGHDLKTPLAALRVRIETVEDETQRARMAATIEDITRTLDEILELARVGQVQNPPEQAELTALAASVVEEFEDMGAPVALAEGPRISAPVHITWLKRALRNLIDNALRYGGMARVSLGCEEDQVILRIEDEGPGIPESLIETITEPFVRGEASRSRVTGGAGLGLTLARAIAEQHGGSLRLANRPEGGLAAELRLPITGRGPA